MNQKAIRIIAYIALGFMLIFSVTIVMVFMQFGGLPVIILASVSGGLGIILFILMKILQKVYAAPPPAETPFPEEPLPPEQAEQPAQSEDKTDTDN